MLPAKERFTICVAYPACQLNVMEVLMENLNRLWRGEAALRNQVV